jgi:ketosteroid isomerase-like protein
MSTPVEAVLRSHLQAAREGVDAVMRDYAEDSVLVTREATYRGLEEIRQFFTTLLNGFPAGFFDAFRIRRQVVAGEMAYILWEAKPWISLATDTFVVRNGKFLLQTFTPYTASD